MQLGQRGCEREKKDEESEAEMDGKRKLDGKRKTEREKERSFRKHWFAPGFNQIQLHFECPVSAESS